VRPWRCRLSGPSRRIDHTTARRHADSVKGGAEDSHVAIDEGDRTDGVSVEGRHVTPQSIQLEEVCDRRPMRPNRFVVVRDAADPASTVRVVELPAVIAGCAIVAHDIRQYTTGCVRRSWCPNVVLLGRKQGCSDQLLCNVGF